MPPRHQRNAQPHVVFHNCPGGVRVRVCLCLVYCAHTTTSGAVLGECAFERCARLLWGHCACVCVCVWIYMWRSAPPHLLYCQRFRNSCAEQSTAGMRARVCADDAPHDAVHIFDTVIVGAIVSLFWSVPNTYTHTHAHKKMRCVNDVLVFIVSGPLLHTNGEHSRHLAESQSLPWNRIRVYRESCAIKWLTHSYRAGLAGTAKMCHMILSTTKKHTHLLGGLPPPINCLGSSPKSTARERQPHQTRNRGKKTRDSCVC